MTPPPDIRIMQRLIAGLWVAFTVLMLGCVLKVATQATLFDLKAIVVEGDTSHHNALTLRANVAPQLSGNFFSVNLTSTRGVFEGLPWVRRAVVKREFPNKLRVMLQEHVPAGVWKQASAQGQDSLLLNTQGEVFEANPGEIDTESLPHFSGPVEQSSLMLQMYLQLNAVLAAHQLAVDELELSARGSWRATLDSGTAIELGRGSIEQVLARTRAFLATITQAAGQWGRRLHKDIESVDLRHANGYAIRLRGVDTIPAKQTTQ